MSEPKKESTGEFQRNLNTFLLTVCVAMSGWVLLEINHLDERMAVQEAIRSSDHDAIVEINRAIVEQAKIIGTMDVRVNRLETIQSSKQIKQ